MNPLKQLRTKLNFELVTKKGVVIKTGTSNVIVAFNGGLTKSYSSNYHYFQVGDHVVEYQERLFKSNVDKLSVFEV